MNSFLLNRQLASISPQALANAQNNRLLQALQNSPHVQFALERQSEHPNDGPHQKISLGPASLAHAAGVNSIAIDKFEGR